MSDAGIHACRSVVSALRLLYTATYEFHYSPTTSTCLVAIVCLPLLNSYCFKAVQYTSHVIHLSQILHELANISPNYMQPWYINYSSSGWMGS